MLMDTSLIIKNQVPVLNPSEIKIPDLKKCLNAFLKGKTGKFGNYVSTKNAIVYRTLSVVDNFQQDVLLLRLIRSGKVHYIGNSSGLTVCESKISFGERYSRRWNETKTQRYLRESGFAMLPFASFTQAGLKLMDAEILEQSGSETVDVIREIKEEKVSVPQHFTGASLFQIGDKCFLFDIDREEIKHGIFNPFIVQLPKAVETIKEAYESLVPMEVRTAMIEGKEVKRQGEFFFIKVKEQHEIEPTKGYTDWHFRDDEDAREGFVTGKLSAQGNRDHLVSLFDDKTKLVSGIVLHTGREHRNLPLDGWFKAVPNTAARSFTITGDID